MNILFVGEDILGSGQKVTLEAAKKLSEKHNVYLSSNAISGEELEDVIRVYTSSLWSGSVLSSFRLFFMLLRFLRREDIDLLYVLSYKWLPVAKFAASLNRVPIIAHLGSFITEEYSQFMGPFSFYVNRFLQSLFLRMLSDGDFVWSPSQFTKQKLEELTRAEVVVIPTYVDEYKLSEDNYIKEELVGEKFYILYVGRLVPVKN